MKGWQFVYLPQFCAPAELPPEMIAFKQQAHRWTKGAMQTCHQAAAAGPPSQAPAASAIKTEAFFHLTNTLVYPLMVLLTLLMYPTFFYARQPDSSTQRTWGHCIFSASLFVLATCSASTFFVFGQRELFGKEAGWKSLLYLPLLMAPGRGRRPEQRQGGASKRSGAPIRRKPSEFVRTPKYGDERQERQERWKAQVRQHRPQQRIKQVPDHGS